MRKTWIQRREFAVDPLVFLSEHANLGAVARLSRMALADSKSLVTLLTMTGRAIELSQINQRKAPPQ